MTFSPSPLLPPGPSHLGFLTADVIVSVSGVPSALLYSQHSHQSDTFVWPSHCTVQIFQSPHFAQRKSPSPYNAYQALPYLAFCLLSDYLYYSPHPLCSSHRDAKHSPVWLLHICPGKLGNLPPRYAHGLFLHFLQSSAQMSPYQRSHLSLSGPCSKQMACSNSDPWRRVYKEAGSVSGNHKGNAVTCRLGEGL